MRPSRVPTELKNLELWHRSHTTTRHYRIIRLFNVPLSSIAQVYSSNDSNKIETQNSGTALTHKGLLIVPQNNKTLNSRNAYVQSAPAIPYKAKMSDLRNNADYVLIPIHCLFWNHVTSPPLLELCVHISVLILIWWPLHCLRVVFDWRC